MTLIEILEGQLIGKLIEFKSDNLNSITYKGEVKSIKTKKILIGSQTAEVILLAFTDGEVAEFTNLEMDKFNIL